MGGLGLLLVAGGGGGYLAPATPASLGGLLRQGGAVLLLEALHASLPAFATEHLVGELQEALADLRSNCHYVSSRGCQAAGISNLFLPSLIGQCDSFRKVA